MSSSYLNASYANFGELSPSDNTEENNFDVNYLPSSYGGSIESSYNADSEYIPALNEQFPDLGLDVYSDNYLGYDGSQVVPVYYPVPTYYQIYNGVSAVENNGTTFYNYYQFAVPLYCFSSDVATENSITSGGNSASCTNEFSNEIVENVNEDSLSSEVTTENITSSDVSSVSDPDEFINEIFENVNEDRKLHLKDHIPEVDVKSEILEEDEDVEILEDGEDAEISEEDEYVEISQEDEYVEISEEDEDVEISQGDEDVEISEEDEYVEISQEDEDVDVEILEEDEDVEISQEDEDVDVEILEEDEDVEISQEDEDVEISEEDEYVEILQVDEDVEISEEDEYVEISQEDEDVDVEILEEDEDVEISEEDEYVEILQVDEDVEISEEDEYVEISQEDEDVDVEILEEDEDVEISQEDEDVEISEEDEYVEISQEDEDVEILQEILECGDCLKKELWTDVIPEIDKSDGDQKNPNEDEIELFYGNGADKEKCQASGVENNLWNDFFYSIDDPVFGIEACFDNSYEKESSDNDLDEKNFNLPSTNGKTFMILTRLGKQIEILPTIKEEEEDVVKSEKLHIMTEILPVNIKNENIKSLEESCLESEQQNGEKMENNCGLPEATEEVSTFEKPKKKKFQRIRRFFSELRSCFRKSKDPPG